MMLKKIDVTVITPFYKGNEYMKRLFACISNNAKVAPDKNIELIIVNDSPECEVLFDKKWISGFELKIINNTVNSGIQKSRVNGIRAAAGEYILMLDQDDLLTENAIKSQLMCVGEADIVVANGIDQNLNNFGRIYRSEKHQKLVMKDHYYCSIGNMIVSPGHCLIKKSAIPLIWCECMINKNGSDDLFLWLLMMGNGCKWVINPESVYIHVDTGANVSLNFQNMMQSSMEVLDFLKQFHMISRKNERLFIRRFRMRKFYEGRSGWRKFIAYIFNPDIAIELLMIKIC